jgi:hypothetical protein
LVRQARRLETRVHISVIHADQNKTEPRLRKIYLNVINSFYITKDNIYTVSGFYSVAKLKKTNISHLLTLDFKNFPI